MREIDIKVKNKKSTIAIHLVLNKQTHKPIQHPCGTTFAVTNSQFCGTKLPFVDVLLFM